MSTKEQLYWTRKNDHWDKGQFQSFAFAPEIAVQLPEDILFIQGFHHPLFRLQQALQALLFRNPDLSSPPVNINFDPEDIYISTLWFGGQLLKMGFTSVVLVLEEGMITPGGLESAAQALQELGLPGWAGNLVNLQSRQPHTLLALRENHYFIREEPFPLVRGIQILNWGNQYPILAELKHEDFWFSTTLYLSGLNTTRDVHDFFHIIPASPTIIGDPLTISWLKQFKSSRLLISLKSKKWEIVNRPAPLENEIQEYPLLHSHFYLSHLLEYFSSLGEKDVFWREQNFLLENFTRIYPAAPVQNPGILFLCRPEKLAPPRQTFQSVKTFDYVLINQRLVVHQQQLGAVKQHIIEHEFKHILRKLKRQF